MEAGRREPGNLTGTIKVRVLVMSNCFGAFIRLLLLGIVNSNTDDSFTLNGLFSALLFFEIAEPRLVRGVILYIESAPCRFLLVTETLNEFVLFCIRRQYGLDNVLEQDCIPDSQYVFGSRLFCYTCSFERKSDSLLAWRVFISVANTTSKNIKKRPGGILLSIDIGRPYMC